ADRHLPRLAVDPHRVDAGARPELRPALRLQRRSGAGVRHRVRVPRPAGRGPAVGLPHRRARDRAGAVVVRLGEGSRRRRVAPGCASLEIRHLTWLNPGMDTPATESAAAGRSTNLTYLLLGGVLVVALVFAFSGSSVMPDDWYALFKAVHVSLAVV